MALFGGRPDPPGAFIASTTMLYEVVGRTGDLVDLENVVTFRRHSRTLGDLVRSPIGGKPPFTVIRPAPETPDHIDP